ncbi:sulfuric ester hydrolase [Aureococcus anophagefferens]|nr:sulfuric ester hydrolase [Aureococcus anophagefferens]
MSSQQTPPRQPTFSTNSAIRALASVAVGALVFGLVFGLRRDKTTTTDRVVARPASAAAKQRPPNLIVFLADDLGRNDVGYAHRDGGPGRIASPRIDALAAESLVLDRFYAQPMCTPTRAALMTGRHAYKTGLAYFVLLANQGTGLPAAEVTVAERLRDAGYSTHMIGKWHLGFAKKAMLPTSRGFDRFFGYCLGSSDYWLHQSPEWTENVHAADLFAARATETFATAPRDKPLFLYYASQTPHAHFVGAPPRHVAAAAAMGFAAGDPRADVASLVAALDEQVGNVVDGVRASRGWENTVLWFMGDNGPEPGTGASSWPLRGAKRTLVEGGVREPSFVYAPGRVAPGASSAPVHVIDVAPTLLGLAGSAAPRGVDGVDARPGWQRRGRGDARTLVLAYDAVNGCGAALRGRFKYVLNAACGSLSPDYAGWEGDERAPFDACATRECLFDLERDPEERADVAAAHPGALNALRAALLAAEAASVPSLVEITPGDDRAAPDRHGGSWVSWLD